MSKQQRVTYKGVEGSPFDSEVTLFLETEEKELLKFLIPKEQAEEMWDELSPVIFPEDD